MSPRLKVPGGSAHPSRSGPSQLGKGAEVRCGWPVGGVEVEVAGLDAVEDQDEERPPAVLAALGDVVEGFEPVERGPADVGREPFLDVTQVESGSGTGPGQSPSPTLGRKRPEPEPAVIANLCHDIEHVTCA